MRSTRALLLAATLLAACASPVPHPSAEDDAGSVPTDAGVLAPDASTAPDAARRRDEDPSCTDGCEIVDLAAGRAHTCALRANGDVLCWGGNRWGELGDGRRRHASCTNRGDVEETDCSPTPVRALTTSAVALGARGGLASAAITSGGAVSAWGIEIASRPGLPTTEHPRTIPELLDAGEPVVDVSIGSVHACVATESGRALCRGLDYAGQLGDGDEADQDALVPVVGLDDVLDVEVAARGAFTCARTSSAVYCWGDGSSGQLGDGLGAHGSCAGERSPFDCARAPVRVSGLGEVASLTAGARHACAIDLDGTVHCWGENAQGQLGADGIERSAAPVAVLAASPAIAISAGATFTCAVTAEGRVLCWGEDGRGQLGDGDGGRAVDCVMSGERSRCSASPAPVPSIENAVGISAGSAHACALTADGAVRCWGENDQRQLGDGTREPRHAPVDVPLEDV